MNQETYEALKRIIKHFDKKAPISLLADLRQVESWIDEVAKEYTEDAIETLVRLEAEAKDRNCNNVGITELIKDNLDEEEQEEYKKAYKKVYGKEF